MSLTDRVFRAFENELVKHLAFSFTLIRRLARDGAPKTMMKVWMRNNSTIDLAKVRGSISPGPAADFRHTPFYLTKMEPGEECEIAEIEVTILEPTHNRFAYDRMASVNVSGTPDLSRFRFKDSGRSLTHVATSIPVSDDPREQTRRRLEGRAAGYAALELDWERGSRKKPA